MPKFHRIFEWEKSSSPEKLPLSLLPGHKNCSVRYQIKLTGVGILYEIIKFDEGIS